MKRAKKKVAKLSASEVEASKEEAGGKRPTRSSKISKQSKAKKSLSSPVSSAADSADEIDASSSGESEHITSKTSSKKPKCKAPFTSDLCLSDVLTIS